MSGEDRILGLPLWSGRPVLTRLFAGRTNENYLVECGNRRYFARVGVDLPHHGVLREQEATAARFAAGLGLAPMVRYAALGLLVTDYVDGTVLRSAGPFEPAVLRRIGEMLRTLHEARPPDRIGRFDPATVIEGYLDRLGDDALPGQARAQIRTLLARVPRLSTHALIHADGIPENFIDDGHRLWLVDWEYAGLGDPATDVAMVTMNFDLAPGEVEELVRAHGAVAPATVEALRPLVAAREALWSLVQLQIGGPEGDLLDYSRRCLRRLGI